MESIYGSHYDNLVKVQNKVLDDIADIKEQICNKKEMNPIEHCLARIKSEESMREKCRRKNIPVNTNSALKICKDAIGIRNSEMLN